MTPQEYLKELESITEGASTAPGWHVRFLQEFLKLHLKCVKSIVEKEEEE